MLSRALASVVKLRAQALGEFLNTSTVKWKWSFALDLQSRITMIGTSGGESKGELRTSGKRRLKDAPHT